MTAAALSVLSPFLGVMLPETVLATGICVVLLVELFRPKRGKDLTFLAAIVTLLACAIATARLDPNSTQIVMGGAFIADPTARFLKLFSFTVVATVFLYTRFFLAHRRSDPGDPGDQGAWGEFYLLGLFALLGIMVMISGYSLLALYLGLELMSLALYTMVAFERDSPIGAESAMKYFVLGAIASGTLLYGISIIYGVTGTLNLSDIAAVLRSGHPNSLAIQLGLAFLVAGIAFKFGAVPFHMWIPDVYHGAPACATLFIATAPKIASFALALRILVEGFGPVAGDWQPMVAVLAVLSLGVGNVLAIAQTNIKRMLGYSTISHVGFILLGLIAGTGDGVRAAMFYTIVYVLMTAAAFGIVILLTRDGAEADQLDDLRGLNERSPWFALVMLLVMISMIGVPPLAGFAAKWWVLTALIDAHHPWLAVAGILFSVIGAFYYLRVIRLMYFEGPEDKSLLRPGFDMRLILSLNGAVILLLGIFPDRLLKLCTQLLG
jgi:NADH-quinone oxidoreductase subunit N